MRHQDLRTVPAIAGLALRGDGAALQRGMWANQCAGHPAPRTIPAPVVQVYIAISAIGASGRVERRQRAAQDPKATVPAGCATRFSRSTGGSALGQVAR